MYAVVEGLGDIFKTLEHLKHEEQSQTARLFLPCKLKFRLQ